MGSQIVVLAERVGFEPTGLLHPQVFKTSSLNPSDTSPWFWLLDSNQA